MSKIVPHNCVYCGKPVGDHPEAAKVSHWQCAFDAMAPMRAERAAKQAAKEEKRKKLNDRLGRTD